MDAALSLESPECLMQRQDAGKARMARARAIQGARDDILICDFSHFAAPLQSGTYQVSIGMNRQKLSSNELFMKIHEKI